MARKAKESNGSVPHTRPALTNEARENQLISLAVDLAEQQLRDGTASSQVITHYLKLGSSREKLEKEYLMKQQELIAAKTEHIKAVDTSEEKFVEAINAMRRYQGGLAKDDDEED